MSVAELKKAVDYLSAEERLELAAYLRQRTRDEAVQLERVSPLHPGAIDTAEDFDAPLPDAFWLGEP